MALVFYDTETTGTDTFFDQILQFAAVLTDADLKVLDRFEIRCRLLPHVVPAPGAMRVTGLRASQLTDASFPSHYEMVRAIRAKMTEWSPATFIGYNSIEFDEGLLRQAFYKTLHSPYLTNSNGNCRSDVLRMVQACSLFAPNVLAIPIADNGKQSFKLDRVAPANGFVHDRAHDAMGDVDATIFLCSLLAERAPEIWSAFMRFSQKASVVNFISDEPMFCLSDFYFGKPYSWIATVLGQNSTDKNEWYVYDLQVDPGLLQGLSDAELRTRLSGSPKPLRRLRSNTAPMLFPAEDAPHICNGRDCGSEELERRANILQADKALRDRLVSAFEALKKVYDPSPHIEKQIYDGFFDGADTQLMETFHQLPWERRPSIVERFKDRRLQAIAMQLMHIERPDLLDEHTRRHHATAASMRLLGHGNDIPWLTLPKALEEIEAMLVEAMEDELVHLQEHRQHLLDRLEAARR